jgi:hypothetical protein
MTANNLNASEHWPVSRSSTLPKIEAPEVVCYNSNDAKIAIMFVFRAFTEAPVAAPGEPNGMER